MYWMSHALSPDTPTYRNNTETSFRFLDRRLISCGDSCSQFVFQTSNHTGTHVDLPAHFIEHGKTLDSYEPSDWVFKSPLLIDVSAKPGENITSNKLRQLIDHGFNPDILLLRTGFEKYRDRDEYWKNSPVFDVNIVDTILEFYPSVKALVLDTISISSPNNRQMGRLIHKALLGNDIRIVEDAKLSSWHPKTSQIAIIPMLIKEADGVPVTIICSMID